MLRLIASLALLALAACTPPATRPPAEAAPLFALAPSALPGGLAEQQRLSFEHGDRRETVDAMVQADADAVRLVIHAQGQVALRLDWDGEQLTQKRMPWVPESLDGARVLSDLQLVFWPAEALRTQLPAGWTLDEDGARLMPIAKADMGPPLERQEPIAKPGIAIAIGMGSPIFLPQQHKGDTLALQFRGNLGPVGFLKILRRASAGGSKRKRTERVLQTHLLYVFFLSLEIKIKMIIILAPPWGVLELYKEKRRRVWTREVMMVMLRTLPLSQTPV